MGCKGSRVRISALRPVSNRHPSILRGHFCGHLCQGTKRAGTFASNATRPALDSHPPTPRPRAPPELRPRCESAGGDVGPVGIVPMRRACAALRRSGDANTCRVRAQTKPGAGPGSLPLSLRSARLRPVRASLASWASSGASSLILPWPQTKSPEESELREQHRLLSLEALAASDHVSLPPNPPRERDALLGAIQQHRPFFGRTSKLITTGWLCKRLM